MSTLVSFSIILWTIPVDFTVPGTDITVPGLPFWVALVLSLVGTWLTHLIGKPLVQLEFRQERYEADFRFALARVREYSEADGRANVAVVAWFSEHQPYVP